MDRRKRFREDTKKLKSINSYQGKEIGESHESQRSESAQHIADEKRF